jgi:hypothetical protein
LICYSEANIFLVLIAKAWLVFSLFLPGFLIVSLEKISYTSAARAYWLVNLHFESQSAEKNGFYNASLSKVLFERNSFISF